MDHESYDIWQSLWLIATEASPSNRTTQHKSEALFYILGGIIVLAIVLIFLYVFRKRIKRQPQNMTVTTTEKQGSLRNEKKHHKWNHNTQNLYDLVVRLIFVRVIWIYVCVCA